MESFGLSAGSVAALTEVSQVGEKTHYLADETELAIETDWERMLEDNDHNEELFDLYGGPRID